jgi:hypothetical protein
LALKESNDIGEKGAIAPVANADATAPAELDLDRRIVMWSGGIDHGDGEEGGRRGSGWFSPTIAFANEPPPRVEGGLIEPVLEAVVADGQAATILLGQVPPPELLALGATLMLRHGRSPEGKPPG